MKPGWKTVKLGDVCKIVNGATPSTSVEANWGGPHCWITPAEMGGLSNPYVGETRRTLTDAGLADCSASLLPAGSVILSSRAPIGHVIINTVPMATNQGCKSMIPSDDLNAKFLFYFIKASVPLLESLGTGATFKELSGGKLASVEIPLPPLAEQKRIVALLDEAFAGIDKAKANAEENMKDAAALFASKLEIVFHPDSLKWIRTTVGNVISSGQGEVKTGPFGTKLSASEYGKEGVPVISVGEIRMGEVLLHERTPRVGPSVTKRMPEYLLEEGDIVFGRKGGVERSAYITEKEAGWFIGSDGIRLRLPSSCNKMFIAYQLLRPTHQKWMKSKATGTTMPSLNQAIIEEIPLLFCDYKMQCAIVKDLETFEAQSKPLRDFYAQKMAALHKLKSGILAQAFVGQLTT